MLLQTGPNVDTNIDAARVDACATSPCDSWRESGDLEFVFIRPCGF
jgi:hypothetical protein